MRTKSLILCVEIIRSRIVGLFEGVFEGHMQPKKAKANSLGEFPVPIRHFKEKRGGLRGGY